MTLADRLNLGGLGKPLQAMQSKLVPNQNQPRYVDEAQAEEISRRSGLSYPH